MAHPLSRTDSKHLEWEFHRLSEVGQSPPAGLIRYQRRLVGGRVAETSLDWDAALYGDLAQISQGAPPAESLERLGDRLRQFVARADPDGELAWLASSDRPASVLLRASAAELTALPWDLLHLGERRVRLGRRRNTTLRHALPAGKQVTGARPLLPADSRVLFVWSDAGGGVPQELQLRCLSAALKAAEIPFDEREDVLARATLARLGARLQIASNEGRPYTALHVLAHGRTPGAGRAVAAVLGAPGKPEFATADAWREQLSDAAPHLELVTLMVCGAASPGEPNGWTGSLAQGISRAGVRAVVASRAPLSAQGSNLLCALLYRLLLGVGAPALPIADLSRGEDLLQGWLDGQEPPLSLEAALNVARSMLQATGAGGDALALQLVGEVPRSPDSRPFQLAPYRGLEAFQPRHARYYFGRTREVDQLHTALHTLIREDRPRIQVLDGPSGSGKSSLILAGLVPRLLESRADAWSWERLVPGNYPVEALKQATQRMAPEGRVLLLVDQFEELFTLVPDAEREVRDRFVQALWTLAAEPGDRVSVLLTLRSDFRARLGELRLEDGQRLDALQLAGREHQLSLPILGEAQLLEIIGEPARAVGLELSPSLAKIILDDIQDEPGALPLLEFTLERLYQSRVDGAVTERAYVALGRATGALRAHADRVIGALSTAERQQARRLFVRMVAGGMAGQPLTRRRVSLRALMPVESPETRVLLDKLVSERLLTYAETVGVSGGRAEVERGVEVAHEALIRFWGTLQVWLGEEQERLDALDELELWVKQRGKFPSFRLSADQLTFASRALERYPEDVGREARALIAESEPAAAAATATPLNEEQLKQSMADLRRSDYVGTAQASAAEAPAAQLPPESPLTAAGPWWRRALSFRDAPRALGLSLWCQALGVSGMTLFASLYPLFRQDDALAISFIGLLGTAGWAFGSLLGVPVALVGVWRRHPATVFGALLAPALLLGIIYRLGLQDLKLKDPGFIWIFYLLGLVSFVTLALYHRHRRGPA